MKDSTNKIHKQRIDKFQSEVYTAQASCESSIQTGNEILQKLEYQNGLYLFFHN
jgi:hypothetical protein